MTDLCCGFLLELSAPAIFVDLVCLAVLVCLLRLLCLLACLPCSPAGLACLPWLAGLAVLARCASLLCLLVVFALLCFGFSFAAFLLCCACWLCFACFACFARWLIPFPIFASYHLDSEVPRSVGPWGPAQSVGHVRRLGCLMLAYTSIIILQRFAQALSVIKLVFLTHCNFPARLRL